MKKLFINLILILPFTFAFSQNIGIGTNSPHPSAKLEVSSNNSGFLPPRMTTNERDAVANPASGLQIFNTTTNCLQMFVLGRWQNVFCGVVDSSSIVDTTLLTDIDGHIYPIVKICDQTWMAKNLDVARYRNGDIIPQVTNPAEWANLTTGAWCWYNNNSANGAIYGRLYNWFAVNDPRGLAPTGWHVSSDAEWDKLANCLGGADIAGGKIKEAGTSHWNTPNLGATNSSGFNALPAGYTSGNWLYMGEQAWWWTSTKYPCCSSAMARYSWNNNTSCYKVNIDYKSSFSVRCVKDTPITTLNNGLVAYYPFSGNAGDSSGNGNHGTVIGATLTTDRIGKPSSCYSFDGVNNVINIDNNSLFTFTHFSISCWVLKSPNSIYMPGIISKCTSLNSGWYLITNTPRIDSLTFGGAVSNGNYFNAFGPKLINDEWYHIACVYSNGIQKLYVDGVLVSSDTNAGPLNNNSEKIRIGFKNGDGHWKGKIDDVRIYNRMLSDQEVAYLATH